MGAIIKTSKSILELYINQSVFPNAIESVC